MQIFMGPVYGIAGLERCYRAPLARSNQCPNLIRAAWFHEGRAGRVR